MRNFYRSLVAIACLACFTWHSADAQIVLDDFNDNTLTGWTPGNFYTLTEANQELMVDFNVTNPAAFDRFTLIFTNGPVDMSVNKILKFKLKTNNSSGTRMVFRLDILDSAGVASNGSPFEFEPIADGQYHEYCLKWEDIYPDRWFSSFPNFGTRLVQTHIQGFEVFINPGGAFPSIQDTIFLDDFEVVPFPSQSSIMFDDFECNRNVTYIFKHGFGGDFFWNPNPNAVNGSNVCADYARNAGVQYDVIVGDFQGNIDMTNYNLLKFDVLDSAGPHPMQISLQTVSGGTRTDLGFVIDTPTVSQRDNWYSAEFDFSSLSNATNCNGFVILMNPNAFNGDRYFWDNFRQEVGTPVATINPIGGSICPGDSFKLAGPALIGATYQWWKDGAMIMGATDSVYWAKSTGNFQVQVIGQTGSDTSSAASIFVLPAPTATITVSGSANDTLTVSVGGTNTYQWFNAGMAISGATDTFYIASTNGNYYVQITDANGCVGNSDTVSFMVGIPQALDGSQLLLYPNPAQNQLTVEYTGNLRGEVRIEVLNVLGQTMKAFKSNGTEVQIPTGNLPAGTYFLRWVSPDGAIQKRFLKMD